MNFILWVKSDFINHYNIIIFYAKYYESHGFGNRVQRYENNNLCTIPQVMPNDFFN